MAKKLRFSLPGVVLITLLTLTACQAQPAAPAPTQAPAKTTAAPAATTAAPATTAPAAAQTSAAAPAAAQTSAPAATAAPAAATPIKLGFMLAMTGPIVRNAVSQERWMRMAVEDIDAKGGIKVGGKTYRFEPVVADDKYSSEGGRAAADTLVLGEKVKFIASSLNSSTPGAQAVADPNKVMLLPAAATDISLGKDHPLTLQIGTVNNWMRVPALYQWLKKSQPTAKNVVLVVSDDVNGKAYQRVAEKAAKDNGLTLLATETFGMDTKDFSPLVARVLRNQNIDAIDAATLGAQVPLFTALMKSLYEQGWRKPVLGVGVNVTGLREMGAPGESYVFSSLVDWKASVVDAKARELMQTYIKKWDEPSMEPSALGCYNAPLVLAQAMEKAGSIDDTEKIAAAMRANTFDTLFGPAKFVGANTFGLSAVLEMPIYMGTAKGGNITNSERLWGTMD